MMPDEQPEASKYTIHIEHAEGLAIGDGAHVIGAWKGKPPIGIPFQAPPLPAHFVPRPEVSDALKARLLADKTPSPGILVRSAIHGMPGIGKSTIAAALAHDPNVQERFSDGILWVTLGQQPDLLVLLMSWIQALGDYHFQPTTEEMATRHLCTLLQNRAVLLIVDDAWHIHHVRSFRAGGSQCHLLITTRDATVVHRAGAHCYSLGVMSYPQALNLFELRLGSLGNDYVQAGMLARELGHLPLALELVAAQVESGRSWGQLLDILRREPTDLAALDMVEATERNESLRLSFKLTLQRLSMNDQAAFPWLGVLASAAQFNSSVASILWNQSTTEATARLRRLRDNALIKSINTEYYMMHDLIHDEAKTQLAKQIPLSEAHAVLLDRYRTRARRNLWHTLPHDGYIHDHLTWHMERANWIHEIHNLLREETTQGRNGWHEAREHFGQTAGYLQDVARGWRLAEDAYRDDSRCTDKAVSDSRSKSIGMQCHYALITSSIVSLVESTPPGLVATMVGQGIWPVGQGVEVAEQIRDKDQRNTVLCELVMQLGVTDRIEDALALSSKVQDQARVLERLVLYLIDQGCLEEAQVIANRIRDVERRSKVLVNLANILADEEHVDEAFAVAAQIGMVDARLTVLSHLAPHLTEPRYAQQAIAALRDVRYPLEWKKVGLSQETVTALFGIPTEWKSTLPVVLENLPTIEREKLVHGLMSDIGLGFLVEQDQLPGGSRDTTKTNDQESVVRVSLSRRFQDSICKRLHFLTGLPLRKSTVQFPLLDAFSCLTLAYLIPYLSPETQALVIPEILAILPTLFHGKDRLDVLVALAPYLAEEQLPEAIAATEDRWNTVSAREEDQADALVELAHLFPDSMIPYALSAIRAISDPKCQVRSLLELLDMLAPPMQDEILEEALTTAAAVHGYMSRAKTITEVAAHLPEKRLRALIATELAIEDPDWHALVLPKMTLRLVDLDQPQEAVSIALGLKVIWPRLRTISELGPYLAKHQHYELCMEALQMLLYDSPNDYVLAMAQTLPHLPRNLREQAETKALRAVRGVWSKDQRAKAATELAHHLHHDLQWKAMATLRKIEDTVDQRSAIVYLTAGSSDDLLEIALNAVLSGVVSDPSASIMQTVARILGQETALGFSTIYEIAFLIARMALCAPLGLLRKLQTIVQSTFNDFIRGAALTGIVPRLAELGYDEEACALAREIEFEDHRALALIRLVPRISTQWKQECILEAYTTASRLPHPLTAISRLAALAPYLPENLLQDALDLQNCRFDYGDDRARLIIALAPYMSLNMIHQALSVADSMERFVGDEVSANLSTRLAQIGYIEESLEVIGKIIRQYWVAHSLIKLIPHVDSEQKDRVIEEAMVVIRRTEGTKSQAILLSGIVGYLTGKLRQEVWQEIITAARSICDPLDRAEVFLELEPHLSEDLLVETLRTIADTGNKYYAARAFATLVPRLVTLPPNTLHLMWQEVIHSLARHPRPHFLASIAALRPVLARLGGTEAASITFYAIQDVGRWWP